MSGVAGWNKNAAPLLAAPVPMEASAAAMDLRAAVLLLDAAAERAPLL